MGDATSTDLPAHLHAWITEVAGDRVVVAERVPGGGRKQAWLIEVERPTGREKLFFRWDPVDPATTGDPWTVRREATIYGALNGSGLPIAELLGMHPTDQAMLATWRSGRASFSSIADPVVRDAVAKDFMVQLAGLHRLDPVAVGLLQSDDDRPCGDFARAQITEMETLIGFRGGEPDPVLTLALCHLRDNVPAYNGPRVIVQGDTGPGNFLFDGDCVTAIVDWELAHVGDPMDDIAWLSLRSVQDPFPDLQVRVDEYAKASVHAIDGARIRYYRVMAEAKILTMSHGTTLRSRADAAGGGGDVGARLIFGQLHRRLCVEALADASGLGLDEVEVREAPPRNEFDDLYDVVFSQLRDVIVPRIGDPFAVQRTKGMVRILKYLAAAGPRRAEFDRLEQSEIAATLDEPPGARDLRATREALSVAIRSGAVAPTDALRLLHRGIVRDNELLRTASGVLAGRHYVPLC